MAWGILFLASMFEIGWTIGLKYSQSFTKFWPSVGTVVSLVISMVLLGLAVRTIPIGTAYAVWAGIGAVGTLIAGILLFGEPAGALRLMFVGLIVAGILGLKFVSPH